MVISTCTRFYNKKKSFFYYLRPENCQFCERFDIKLVCWPWFWCTTCSFLGNSKLQRWRPVHSGTYNATPDTKPCSQGSAIRRGWRTSVPCYPCITPQHPRDSNRFKSSINNNTLTNSTQSHIYTLFLSKVLLWTNTNTQFRQRSYSHWHLCTLVKVTHCKSSQELFGIKRSPHPLTHFNNV